jgi:ZipA, C-terminal FtsZ-binding domain
VVARARELDGLAAPLDAQLTVTLRTNGVAWSVPFVQQVAARLGFVPGVLPGRMVLPSPEEGDPPMLVLAVDAQAALSAADESSPLSSPIRECTLALDVPQTAAAREPFPAWHLAARKLSDDLDATLGDDQGQPISLQAFAEIGQELDGLYMRLEALGLAAGTPAARRVFG